MNCALPSAAPWETARQLMRLRPQSLAWQQVLKSIRSAYHRIHLSHLNVTLSELTNGQTRTIEQVASEGHMDPHYQSLAILAQRLADFGHTLQPGQYVITGAYGKTPFEVGRFAGDFSLGIGRAELELTGR